MDDSNWYRNFFYEIVHHFFKDVKAGKPGVPYRLLGPMF